MVQTFQIGQNIHQRKFEKLSTLACQRAMHVEEVLGLINSYQNQPDLARSSAVYLSDGRCNSSSAEAGVLTAIIVHGPTPPVGGTHYHQKRASPNHYCIHHGRETPVTYPAASHPPTRGVFQ
ncbi:hypothetical protein AVEN_145095-1 [Araneus ventricosus]|uniref:Uncharacterized protein n=1 Tax=Araneus ventricosus TaxID=182803 RepID=A0A4Y2LRX9_ARAVE|nr:hypothetical protein AVEN_145095-1 [Araneus ventricosus]